MLSRLLGAAKIIESGEISPRKVQHFRGRRRLKLLAGRGVSVGRLCSSNMRKPVSTLLCILSLCLFAGAPGAYAGENDPYFPKPSYFRKAFGSAPTRVDLAPPVQIEDYVVAGKLELSLKSFLALVMANNADISIQRLTVELSRNALAGSFGSVQSACGANWFARLTANSANS